MATCKLTTMLHTCAESSNKIADSADHVSLSLSGTLAGDCPKEQIYPTMHGTPYSAGTSARKYQTGYLLRLVLLLIFVNQKANAEMSVQY
jgi:hypothetical protein